MVVPYMKRFHKIFILVFSASVFILVVVVIAAIRKLITHPLQKLIQTITNGKNVKTDVHALHHDEASKERNYNSEGRDSSRSMFRRSTPSVESHRKSVMELVEA